MPVTALGTGRSFYWLGSQDSRGLSPAKAGSARGSGPSPQACALGLPSFARYAGFGGKKQFSVRGRSAKSRLAIQISGSRFSKSAIHQVRGLGSQWIRRLPVRGVWSDEGPTRILYEPATRFQLLSDSSKVWRTRGSMETVTVLDLPGASAIRANPARR